MTDKQENFFSMFVILHGYLEKHASVVESFPAFKRAYDKLGSLIEDIKNVDSGRQTIRAGKSELKSTKKNDLTTAIFQLASALYTYADENNLPEILNRVDKGESYYKRLRDTNLLMEARDLVNLCAGKEVGLLEHGLTAEEIAGTVTLANEFETAMKEMGTSEAEGSTATKSVYELIGETKDLIDNQLNVHAAKFKTKDPDFYSQYLSAIRIIDTGVRHEKAEEPSPGQPA